MVCTVHVIIYRDKPSIPITSRRNELSQVKSSTNTPVMQGAKQKHIERRCDCELPRQSCRLGRACVDFFLYSGPALVLFGTPLQRKCEGRWDL